MKSCEVFWKLVQLVNSVAAEADGELAPIGLDAKGLQLLSLIERHPNPALLAKTMAVPPSTVTFLLKRATSAGWLVRRGVPDDLRKFHFALTPAGGKVVRQGRTAIDRIFGRRLGRMTHAQSAALVATLDKLGGDAQGDDATPTSG